jgi:Domain of unknown function (DUF4157)
MRKSSCACGGGCPACQSNSGLKVSSPSDSAELEADRIADTVMRKSDDSHRAEQSHVHVDHASLFPKREFSTPGDAISGEIGERIASTHGKGAALDTGTRAFMESRFAMDLGGVRVHAGNEAAELNRDLSARAFTFGSDIFFGEGAYRPETDAGRHLIAHELAHVGQGGPVVRRCADAKDEATYDAKIAEIKALDTYTSLDADAKTKADTIITEGRAKADCLYYAKKLKVLFTTAEKGTEEVVETQRKRTTEAVKAEETRLKTDEAQQTLNVEEEATKDPEPEPQPPVEEGKAPPPPPPPKKGARNWTTYPTRFGGGIYKVDATDLANIYVKVKINLVPRQSGTWDDVKKIKSLEDGIEKHASRRGFVLNVEFVNPTNDPDFKKDDETVEIFANPRWPNARNWGGDARTCAHELYHVLNFPLDRYNYIEHHSKNEQMMIPERLKWFLEQMHKPADFDKPESLMGSGQYPIEEDICKIAQLDVATCVEARKKLLPPEPEPEPEASWKLRTPFGFTVPTIGYANLGGSSGMFASWGYDFSVPITYQGDWRLFLGAHATLLSQLEADKRLAFLIGARLSVEKAWSTSKKGGLVVGGFGEVGEAFVQDKDAPGSTSFVHGAYGYGGVNLGYRVPNMDLTFDAELGGGATEQLGLHDPTTFIRDSQMVPFFTAGVRATFMFGRR